MPTPPAAATPVPWARPEFLYTDRLSYRVNTDGTLQPLFELEAINGTENGPNLPEEDAASVSDFATGPDGKHLYAAQRLPGSDTGGAVQYRVARSGDLATLRDLIQSDGAVSLAFGGRFAYVLCLRFSPTRYSIRGYRTSAGGKVNVIGTAPLATGTFAIAPPDVTQSALRDPQLRANSKRGFLYVIHSWQRRVEPYRIMPSGTLAPLPAKPLPCQPDTFLFHPDGRHVYMTSRAEASITDYKIGADGSLVSPTRTPLGGRGGAAALDPGGHYLYAVSGEHQVSCFSIKTQGELHPLEAVTLETYPYLLTVDQTGRFVYALGNVGDSRTTITALRINRDGTLTPLRSSQVPSLSSLALVTAEAFR